MISTKHWHSHKVVDIECDTNQEYLFTSGLEGVIVIWSLKNEKKTFIPRLPSEITSISVSKDFQYMAVTLKDNSIKVLR